MKKTSFNLKNICLTFVVIAVVTLVSCKKYNSLGFTPGSGAPSISSVHTWSKTDTTVRYDTIITYNSSGDTTLTIQQAPSKVNPFDSATTAGNLGEYYIIYGSNLGSTTSITFNGYAAYFNRALITDKSIVVQVPAKTPYFGSQANDSLVITTLHGTAVYKFTIIPPPPTPATYSNYNFSDGSQITLTGVGFASVSSITIAGASGGSADVSIVSQNDSVLVLQFPSTTVTRGNLVFSYNAGGTTSTVTATQELVDLDNAYQIFTDNYGPSWGSWSWDNAGPSTAKFISGTASFGAQFSANSWHIDGFRAGGGGATDGLQYSPDYTYLSFWVYGGTQDEKIYIEWGNEGFGNGGGNEINEYDVPPGVWTYYKIPIANLLWNTGTTNWAANNSQYLNTVAFFMNSNSINEQLYFDDVILIK